MFQALNDLNGEREREKRKTKKTFIFKSNLSHKESNEKYKTKYEKLQKKKKAHKISLEWIIKLNHS